MAERLTSKNTVSVYNNSNSEIYLGKGEEATKYIYKLAQYEDILEKYGIESVEELEKKLSDSDTLKRACELECDVLRDINYKIYNEDRIDFENIFYQEAKTEGNDEK